MSLLSRRIIVMLPLLLGAAACGFTPVYTPDGNGTILYDNITLPAPETLASDNKVASYFLVRTLESRLGRGSNANYALSLSLTTEDEGQAITADNQITRYSIVGKVDYVLTRLDDGAILSSGRVQNFTGYSATGSTVETLSGERDAVRRLMTILADQINARLLATADLSAPTPE